VFALAKTAPAALWESPETVSVNYLGCGPEDVRAAAKAAASSCGFDISAVDLVRTVDGRLVFLEANPDCDWGWFEDAAGKPGVVANLVARELELRLKNSETESCA
jgi:hypothetical protein